MTIPALPGLPTDRHGRTRDPGRTRDLARTAALVVLGSLLITASDKVQVPLWPVPVTMQSLVVLLVGMAYGTRLGAATVLAYLAQGLAGLPVFAGAGAGLAYVAGPTGGYLLGFLLAAACAGWLAERGWDRGPARIAAVLCLGHALLFAPGVAWLAVLFGGSKAVAVGLTPFLAGSAVKVALGTALVAAAGPLLRRESRARS